MGYRPPGKVTLIVAMCAALAGAGGAEAPSVKVPPELAKVLSAARDDLSAGRAGEAVARLEAFTAADHALRHLLLGHGYARLNEPAKAAGAYRRALALDAGLTQAAVGLGQVHAREEDWPKAAEMLGRGLAVDSCDSDALYLYAQVAARLSDGRLCRLLVNKGIARFPRDGRFRRLDLAALIEEGDYDNAARAAHRLLSDSPGEPLLWRQLAHAAGGRGSQAEQLPALEAAMLCDPADLGRRRDCLAALLAAGDWLSAVRLGEGLLSGPLAERAQADAALMDSLIRAADMGGRDELLAGWLRRVPEAARTPAMRLAEARSALRRGENDQARLSLRQLIAAGQASPDVFLWAGHIAERAEDWPEAETYFDHARRSAGPAGNLATLYLARLWFRRGRAADAVRLLRAYLNSRPEDAPARALLALIEPTQGP